VTPNPGSRPKKISQVTLSVFYHSTEDPEKVRKALQTLLPEGVEAASVQDSVVRGHHGNDIGIISMRIAGRSAGKVVKHILCSLPELSRKILLATLSTRVGAKPSHIHLRFGKQAAFEGRVELEDGDDVIKVSITLTGARSIKDVSEFFNEVLVSCDEEVH